MHHCLKGVDASGKTNEKGIAVGNCSREFQLRLCQLEILVIKRIMNE